jgi:fructuronate reductase
LLDTPGLVARIAAPETRLVTLTVSEKGYLPGSRAVAILAEALAKRADGITIISCDSLPRNGALLRDAVLAATRRRCALPGRGDPATPPAHRIWREVGA